MENTLENKVKLFTQYWGQYVGAKHNMGKGHIIETWNISTVDYLELTPLSAITDEHALMVASLMWIEPTAEKGRGYLSDDIDVQMTLISDVVDLVRSLGYAVRWNSISVEEQIKMGWTKLREDV